MSDLLELGQMAKEASYVLAKLSAPEKNRALVHAAEAMVLAMDEILDANKKDVTAAVENGIKGAFIDRLTLTKDRVLAMADGLKQVAALQDPVG